VELVPAKGRSCFGAFVADLRRVQAAGPENDPASAIAAILQGSYPGVVRQKYERPENRLADIEQLAVLAARYSSLERMLAELLLAGDVYGMETAEGAEPADALVLSTVHQAKGLEWSRVFILRLIEDSFPHYRALGEPGGEDEERRIFYVAVTRAMDELYLVYPLVVTRGGRGPTVVTRPSRLLTEVGADLYELAVIEREPGRPPGGRA
jgi:DNA helicase-2/ATP-dependent DNA helicase PcrA